MRKRPRSRPQPDRALTLTPVTTECPECQHRLYADYNNFRTITTLDGVFRLTLTIRRCPNPACSRFLRPYRPEAEPHFALPYHEFGLDVLAGWWGVSPLRREEDGQVQLDPIPDSGVPTLLPVPGDHGILHQRQRSGASPLRPAPRVHRRSRSAR